MCENETFKVIGLPREKIEKLILEVKRNKRETENFEDKVFGLKQTKTIIRMFSFAQTLKSLTCCEIIINCDDKVMLVKFEDDQYVIKFLPKSKIEFISIRETSVSKNVYEKENDFIVVVCTLHGMRKEFEGEINA